MRIHHVGYLTKNMESSKTEFQKLGFVLEQDVKYDPHRKIDIAFLQNGEYRIELIEPKGIESPLYPLLKRYKNTPYHFCYTTTEMDSEIARLEQNDYRVIQEPLEAPCLGDAAVVFLMHPDVGIIELVEMNCNQICDED